jgi:hypothetical protein
MNKNKLKEFVNALDGLSDDVKDWEVDINFSSLFISISQSLTSSLSESSALTNCFFLALES